MRIKTKKHEVEVSFSIKIRRTNQKNTIDIYKLNQLDSISTDNKIQVERNNSEYLHLSIFSELLNKYSLSQNSSSSFFELIQCMKIDGKRFAVNKLLESTTTHQINAIINCYNNIINNTNGIEINFDKIKIDSPILYKSNIGSLLIEYNLQDISNSNFSELARKLLLTAYESGIRIIANKLQSNIEWLKKVDSKSDKLEREIAQFYEELEHEMTLISNK